MPSAPNRGTPRESQAKFRDGTVSGLYKGLRGQYSWKIRFIEKPGVQDEGVRHVANRSSDTWVAYPEVKVEVPDLVRVWLFLLPLTHGGRYPGRIRFIESQGVNGQWTLVPCVPSSGMPQESQTKFRDRVWIVDGSCGYRIRVVSIREKFVLSRNLGTRRWGVVMWLNVVLTPA